MCGIAGGMSKTGAPIAAPTVKAMQTALSHRGPDGQGEYFSGPVSFVHTRLAIIDPEHGKQPFIAPRGVAVVANGEIYNDLEIRDQLGNDGYATASDNESILHAYLRHGERFADQLQGMYAAAIYDSGSGRLLLARDPLGIKPLYVADTPQALWFASEVRAFLDAGIVPRQENEPGRDALFALQFVPGQETAVGGVRRVAPSETLVIEGGHIVDRRLRAPDVRRIENSVSLPERFEEIWLSAVQRHCRSDVPYGLFLSGGLDSAAVLAAMARLESRPVITYTAGFDSPAVHDETQQAARVAGAVGAEHRPIQLTADDFVAHLPQIAAALDDPVADYAVVPTALLARAAAADLKVILTGEGGDEVFGGYGRYRAARRPWPFAKPLWAKSHVEAKGVLRERPASSRAVLSATEHALQHARGSKLQRAQKLDVAHWLPDDLLTKLDRCLMTYGLEGRVPFLDDSVAHFGLNLADREKIRGRYGKWMLRQWLAQTLPEADPFAHKRGFSVPVAEWIARIGPNLGPLVARQPGVMRSCDPDRVRRLFGSVTARTGLAAWILLFYALWHQCHIVGASSDGDIFSVLSAT